MQFEHQLPLTFKRPLTFSCKHQLPLHRLVACGDGTGAVRVFKLSWSLSNLQPQDMAVLEDVVSPRGVGTGGQETEPAAPPSPPVV